MRRVYNYAEIDGSDVTGVLLRFVVTMCSSDSAFLECPAARSTHNFILL